MEKTGLPLVNQLTETISDLKKELLTKLPEIYQVEKEMGASQIEVKTKPTSNLSDLCDHIIQAKIIIHAFAQARNLKASFAAQPFEEDCGNSLQFNISWQNVEENFDQSIASLLHYTNQMLPLLASKASDYLRFDLHLNKALHQKGKYVAPTYLTYGDDNRTAAIRLVESRLEYRVACADADPYLVTIAILFALLRGKKEGLQLKEAVKVYGNAFDQQYAFQKIQCDALENTFIAEILEILFEVIFDNSNFKNS